MRIEKRQTILKTAYALLNEHKDPNKVTVREVAKRANVGTGLINYHFSSKDAMLMEAIGVAMAEVANQWRESATIPDVDPVEALRGMLSMLMSMGAEQFYLIQLAAKFELTEGDIHTPNFILPFVQRITGFDHKQAQMIAFSMICNLQSAALRNAQFKDYMGIDLENEEGRNQYLEILIKSHLNQMG